MKYYSVLVLIVISVSGCISQDAGTETHGTAEAVEDCFEHHSGKSYDETLKFCQEDICGSDIHCFEEVEEFSQKYID